MKSRLVNISRHPTCTGEGERQRRRERERLEERKGGNTREEFSCSLTPILGFMLGAEARMNTHTLDGTCIPQTLTEHIEEKSTYKMFTYKHCTHTDMHTTTYTGKIHQRKNMPVWSVDILYCSSIN